MISGFSAVAPETTSDSRQVRVTADLLNAGTTIVTSGKGIFGRLRARGTVPPDTGTAA